MFCSISGEVPTEPVVSKLTGHVYERRLIDKYLREKGQCPMSQQPMTTDDLIAVKTTNSSAPVRPPTATSIPGLLAILQNEWDVMMLESFTLKKQLDTTRQELSHALFQYDAACRLIAKLLKEKQEEQKI